ncbi:hypothetical protein FOS14_16070 [Skermania sp. ID1734]|uniref:ribbon-helix-helix domain-containing protein n=1 Tax=Skermania sp. ID1734 TaxID=2597516 RepID=UPI00118076E0|nr:CopG family transcriptional regulator [Skermania sp. ID1734]TSD96574.1 hypothetical protein FOS14_16070 [Skermania sp. ID1734]
MSRLTDDEYAEMAADYAANPLTADEVLGPVEIDPAVLRTGRPTGTSRARGRTPTTSVRLPEPLRTRLTAQAAAENVAPAEVIRRALVEYFQAHSSASTGVRKDDRPTGVGSGEGLQTSAG